MIRPRRPTLDGSNRLREAAPDWSLEQWQSKKNVSANRRHMAIGQASAPTRLSTMGCAKNATRKGVQQRQILMWYRARAASDGFQSILADKEKPDLGRSRRFGATAPRI
jgi:hypothetical protein